MAQIIPEDSLTASYPGSDLYHCLQQLADDYLVFQQLSAQSETAGLRYWVTREKQSVIIATLPKDSFSQTTADASMLRHSPLVFELIQERNALLPELLSKHAPKLLPIILLLPDHLASKQTIHLQDEGLLAIGDALHKGAMPLVLERCLGMAVSAQVNQIIRGRFNPEAIIHRTTSEVKNTLKLMDIEQFNSLSQDINSNTRPNNQPFSLRLLQGISGSGKTTVLIHRAALLSQRHPKAKILVLSHNKAINNSLKSQISQLTGKVSNVHCHPFLEWCRKLLGGTREFIYEDQATELFDLMIQRHFEDTELSRHGLIREINFIKDRMIATETEYLNTLRSSQSFALSNPVRKRIWQAMIEVDTQLKSKNRYLWSDAPAFLLNEFNEGKTFEPFKYVLIDEAQYFAPAWIKVIKRALAPNSQLFLTSDPDQGFYNRNLSWKETGLDFRGRSTRLKHSYRCSPAISKVVDAFRLHRLMEEAPYPLYSINHIDPISPESHPQLLHFPTKEDQQNRLTSEINQLLKQGFSANDILILNADKNTTRLMGQEIRTALGVRTLVLTGSMIMDDTSIKICDLETATGLQSKIVFITSLESILNPENDPDTSERERNSLRVNHTHLLHMAMTRTSEKLYLLLSTPDIPKEFIIDGLDTPTRSRQHLAPVMYLNQ